MEEERVSAEYTSQDHGGLSATPRCRKYAQVFQQVRPLCRVRLMSGPPAPPRGSRAAEPRDRRAKVCSVTPWASLSEFRGTKRQLSGVGRKDNLLRGSTTKKPFS